MESIKIIDLIKAKFNLLFTSYIESCYNKEPDNIQSCKMASSMHIENLLSECGVQDFSIREMKKRCRIEVLKKMPLGDGLDFSGKLS